MRPDPIPSRFLLYPSAQGGASDIAEFSGLANEVWNGVFSSTISLPLLQSIKVYMVGRIEIHKIKLGSWVVRVSTLKTAYPKWGVVCGFLRRRLGIKHGLCPINLLPGSQGISSSCGARRTVCSPRGEACGWAANVHSSLVASSRSGVSGEGLIPSLCQ